MKYLLLLAAFAPLALGQTPTCGNLVRNPRTGLMDCVGSGTGGGGSYVVDAIAAGAPSANCTAPTTSTVHTYIDSTNGDEWWCYATNSWKKMLSVTGSGPWGVTGGVGSPPSTPASGFVSCGFDSTLLTEVCVNENVATYEMVRVWSGTAALGTAAISSAACATVVTVSATGVASTDVVAASFNGDPTAVTGYVPSTAGMLTIFAYPTANNVNFKVCNNTTSSITPGAITLNWRVSR